MLLNVADVHDLMVELWHVVPREAGLLGVEVQSVHALIYHAGQQVEVAQHVGPGIGFAFLRHLVGRPRQGLQMGGM